MYLADLGRNEQNLTDHLSQEHRDHRTQVRLLISLLGTLTLSFNQILAQEPKTANLLSVLAMLAPRGIPERVLRRLAERDVDFKTAIGTVSDYALIRQETGGETGGETGAEAYTIHSLVRASVHYWLEQKSQKADYATQALQLLAEEFPTTSMSMQRRVNHC
jgi:hypothetical protein